MVMTTWFQFLSFLCMKGKWLAFQLEFRWVLLMNAIIFGMTSLARLIVTLSPI